MSTTEQINAYLAWRSEREGKTVDVSPEAYERYWIVQEILQELRHDDPDPELQWDDLAELVRDYDRLEDN